MKETTLLGVEWFLNLKPPGGEHPYRLTSF